MPPRSVSFRKSIISFPYISYHIMREITICNDDFCNYAIIVSIKQLGDVAMRFRLGSPFGKIGINDDFAPHLDSFKHSLELADILGAKHICLFSFYGTSDIDPVLEALAMWDVENAVFLIH